MRSLFKLIFGRYPNTSEASVLNRLRKVYGEDLVKDAIKASAVVVKGSPIKYISAVCLNFQREERNSTVYKGLFELTEEKLGELDNYE